MEIISRFKEKPKTKMAWKAMWYGIFTLLIFPVLGIFAALISPLLDKVRPETDGFNVVAIPGFLLAISALTLSITALVYGIKAFRLGERSWVLWTGLIPATLVGSFWIIMIGGELLIPHDGAPGELKFTGFIRNIENKELYIDDAEFLSGEEAKFYGAMDTECEEANIEYCIPSMNNDFYIRNLNTSTRKYSVSEDAEIIILSSPGSPIQSNIDFAGFLKIYPRENISQPFHFVLKGEKIIRIEEQYTP